MIEIIHVSDLHFGKSKRRTQKAQRLLKDILQRYTFSAEEGRYLLVTGDITHHGWRKEYNLASEALKAFKGRIFLTPGNHDYGSFFGTQFSKKKAKFFDIPFAKNLEFQHEFLEKKNDILEKKIFSRVIQDATGQAKLMIIGLNSCTYKDLQDFSRGEIGTQQRSDLLNLLGTSDSQIPKLLFLHHIPDMAADYEEIMTLEDRWELMEIVKGQVDVIAFGHQGKFRPVGTTDLVQAPSRLLKARSIISEQKRIWMLDANNSVPEQAFYRISVDGIDGLSAELVSVE